ncbi:MAG: LacI family DNA-binding transcriptional regulator [Flavisolibacter sp.]
MKKKISIHDIAKNLGVSAATVSLVLNGKAEENKIRPEVVEKIKTHVKEVGYRPNLVAKSLRTGKSRLIGMLVEGISDYFFSSIARIVEVEAHKAGYRLFYSSSDGEPEKAKAVIKAFRERQVDGYIIAPTPGIEDDIQSLLDDHSPVVLFDRFLPEVATTNVVINNYQGAYDAVKHLIKNGYSNIGFVTLASEQVQMLDRLRGFNKAISESKKQSYVAKVAYSLLNSDNVDTIKSFINNSAQLDAIFFATNYLTFAGLQAIKDLKLSIPGDLAIISFDDNVYFNLHSPSISAVAQPVEEISNEIIKQLTQRLNDTDRKIENETIVLSTQLVIRESSLAKKSGPRTKVNRVNPKTKTVNIT